MSLSTSLVLNARSDPTPHLNTYNPDHPIGVVVVDGLTIQAIDAADLRRLAESLIVAAELVASAPIVEAVA